MVARRARGQHTPAKDYTTKLLKIMFKMSKGKRIEENVFNIEVHSKSVV